MHQHSKHPEIIKRLKRANGHLSKIIDMIEAGEPCLDVAQQLQAVYKAVSKAKQVYVHNHIEECIDGSEVKLNELKEITKYL